VSCYHLNIKKHSSWARIDIKLSDGIRLCMMTKFEVWGPTKVV